MCEVSMMLKIQFGGIFKEGW